jgi:hypothetical protein
MAGLSDMEELLSRIQNKDITDYMREALGCYSASAYRACVVLCYIAVFDDLRQKLVQLASINSTAKTISKEVEQRAKDQQIYESYMIDQLKSVGLITEIEAFRLEQIRILRNKAAHPSGLHPSPEEARYVYFETIDKFLSKQVLKTTHGVDAITARLKNDNYFPSQTVDDIAAIVASELANIHPLAYSYLVVELVEANESAEVTLSKNAARFLSGLAAKDDTQMNVELRNRLLIPKADNSSKHLLLMSVVSVNPNLLLELEGTTSLRLRTALETSIETEKLKPVASVSHPAVLLGKVIDKLGAEYVDTNLAVFSKAATTTFCYYAPIIRAATKSSKLREVLVGVWKEKAGSSDFGIANTFAESASQIDSLLQFLTPVEAFEIVLRVCKAADWNAFSAIHLRDGKFSSTPVLRELAKKYPVEDPTTADQLSQQLLAISAEEFLQKYVE